MSAGEEGGVLLLRVVDQLCAELGYAGRDGEILDARSPLHRGNGMSGVLTAEEQALVGTMRRGLAKVAEAVAANRDEWSEQAVRAALDGAEMVMRGELVSGNAGQLPSLMPSFVFMVTLPVVGQDVALDLSRRTAELIERAQRS